jgi:serine/threonine-protein kinase
MEPMRMTAFGVWLIGIVAFILVSGGRLPATVASHFGFAGHADAFMSRPFYLAFMCAFAAGIPMLLVALPTWIARRWPRAINLPNRDYWLAPQRLKETTRSLTSYFVALGVALSLLLAFVHWEVVQANLRTPPALDNGRFAAAMIAFVLAAIFWSVRFFARFRRPR